MAGHGRQPGDAIRLGADRYGGPEGTLLGGSGRCGAYGPFNAKGIGPTPLASTSVDYAHAHGLLPLTDAIMEVIAGEVVCTELPQGGVPIIALIDTGVEACTNLGRPAERCAIIVRPNFFRIAHVERSILFGSSGFRGADQELDGRRTRDAIEFRAATDGTIDLRRLAERLTCQIGASRAHRLWIGRASSDNLTWAGAALDYGCVRALPHWRRAGDGNWQWFGNEVGDIAQIIRSVAETAARYDAPVTAIPTRQIKQLLSAMIDDFFGAACLHECGMPSNSDASKEFELLMLGLFEAQQRSSYLTTDRYTSWQHKDWIYYSLSPAACSRPASDDKLWRRVKDIVARAAREADQPVGLISAAASTWLQPRVLRYYHIAKWRARRIAASLSKCSTRHARARLSAFIRHEVTHSRRVFPTAPAGYIVRGFINRERDNLYLLECARSGTLRGAIETNRSEIVEAGLSSFFRDEPPARRTDVELTEVSVFPGASDTVRFHDRLQLAG